MCSFCNLLIFNSQYNDVQSQYVYEPHAMNMTTHDVKLSLAHWRLKSFACNKIMLIAGDYDI